MSPYILLHDQARTGSVATPDHLSLTMPNLPTAPVLSTPPRTSSTALDDFLEYADHLLVQPAASDAPQPLLSPSSHVPRRRSSSHDHSSPTTMKEAIDLAILRSNLSSSSSDQPSQSTNRFTIARAGQHVAVISMLRPAYRLGETVIGVIDFVTPPDSPSSSALIPTYALSITLETVERVDPSLALRSASSVQRATRKIHAQVTETVLFAHRTTFRLEIPTSATPTFETTGVHLAWRLRVEFITARATTTQVPAKGLGISTEDGSGSDEEDVAGADNRKSNKNNNNTTATTTTTTSSACDLLEEVVRDERGVVLIAKERLVAETFEVAVPIRVYGVAGLGTDGTLGNGMAEPLEV